METNKKLFVVLIEDSHYGSNFVGGVFDNKEDMDNFIKKEKLGKIDNYEVEEVLLNVPNYELLDGMDEEEENS